MGCCFSRTSTSPPTPHPKLRKSPPPTLQEETVKEVLTTQTPNNKAAVERKSLENLKNGEKDLITNAQVKDQLEFKRNEGFEVETQSVEIEVSEITVATENRSVAEVSVSLSESVSAATVNGEKRGEEVMSKSRDRGDSIHFTRRQRSNNNSPAKPLRRRPYSGEQAVIRPREQRVRSPAKRALTAPSPEKKTQTRAPRGRSQSPATLMHAGPARVRRDSGERSGRRSRSPASNLSQNRAGSLTEVNPKVSTGQSQNDGVCKPGTVEEDNEACHAAYESLDNPLVSLECFIFL